MPQHAERLDRRQRLQECDQDAAVAVRGEGESPVGDPEPRRPGGLDEAVGPGDLDMLDVPERRAQAPRAEAGLETAAIHLDPCSFRGDPEGAGRLPVAGVEAEREAGHDPAPLPPA